MESRTSRFSDQQAQQKIIEQSYTPAVILSNRLSGLIVFGNKIRLYIDPDDKKNPDCFFWLFIHCHILKKQGGMQFLSLFQTESGNWKVLL